MDSDPQKTDQDLIPINGQFHQPAYRALRLVALLSVLVGLASVPFAQGPQGFFPLSLGVGFGVVSLFLAGQLARSMRFLRVTETGFVYVTHQGEREFLDSDVMCVSLFSRENFFLGRFQSVTRRFILWVETDALPERIVCDTCLKNRAPDPLQPFVLRILSGLQLDAREAYQSGKPVEGDGWCLERGQLILRKGRSVSLLPISELTAVEIVDEQVCIWREGQDLPVAKVSVRTANAHLLLFMLQELITPAASSAEPAPGGNRLGRVIFERRQGSRTLAILGWTLVGLLAFVSILLIFRAIIERRPGVRTRVRVAATVLTPITIALALVMSRLGRTRFRRHAHGVALRGLFSERSLYFSDIASISYVYQKHYSHGIYSGTSTALTFTPANTKELSPIRFGALTHHTDTEIEKLRDDVASMIAQKMYHQLQRAHFFPWLSYLIVRLDRLEYRPLTFMGRKNTIQIPFDKITNFNVNEGTFYIWVEGQRKPVLTEETTQPNFFPGLTLFSQLLQQGMLAPASSSLDDPPAPHLTPAPP